MPAAAAHGKVFDLKKKVLFVMSSLRQGGAERSLVNLLQALDYEKYEIDLLLFQKEGAFLSLVPPQVNIIDGGEELACLYAMKNKDRFNLKHPILSAEHFLFTFLSRKRTSSPEGSRQYRWVRYYKKRIPSLNKTYDAAVSYLQCEQLYYLVDKVSAGRKLAWIHTDYSKIKTDRGIDLSYFREVDGIVSISDECVSILKEIFPPVADRCHMLPNINSSETIRRLSEEFVPPEYPQQEGVLKIVSVGRVVQLKGFDMAVEAAAELVRRKMDFKWFIIGDGPLKSELELTAQKLGVGDRIIFAGLKSNPYPYVANADIMVQTSRYEGKSVVLDEAKILGTPIVSTDYTTVHDQVSEHEGVITAMTGVAVADGIQQMARDKERYAAYLLGHEYGNTQCVRDYESLIDGATEQ